MQEKADLAKIDDETLMQRVKQFDDRAAFEIFIKRHYQQWFYFAMRMITNEAIAEELIQETCFKIWDKRQTWQHRAKVNTWVYKMIYHICLDHLKSNQHKHFVALKDESSQQPMLEQIEHEEVVERLKNALNELSVDQKAIFILHYYHNFRQPELSNMFQLSKSAIESLLFRVRKKLREQLL